MCTEMTNIHDDMIGLWQFLYICKAEKTHLNDKVVIGGLCLYMIGLWQFLYICKAEKTHLNDNVVIGGLCV